MYYIEEILNVFSLTVVNMGMFLLFQEEMTRICLKHFCSTVGNLTSDHSQQTDLCVLSVFPRILFQLQGMSPDTSGSGKSPVGAQKEGNCNSRSWGTPQLKLQAASPPTPSHHPTMHTQSSHHTCSILGGLYQQVDDVTREVRLPLHLHRGQFATLTCNPFLLCHPA